jgi:hypothetical protein
MYRNFALLSPLINKMITKIILAFSFGFNLNALNDRIFIQETVIVRDQII